MEKIAIVTTIPMTRHGVTSVVLNLLSNIDQTKGSVLLLTALPVEEWFEEELANLNIAIVRIKAKRIKQVFSYVSELTALLKKNEISVFHVHGNSATMWLEVCAAKKANVPVRIAHSHNSSCSSYLLHKAFQPLLIRDMTLGIGCSDLSRKFAFDDKKSIVLNNGIDTQEYKYDKKIRQEYRANFAVKDKLVVGHVGNLLEVKNHLFICKVAAELKLRGNKNICFFFVGEGVKRKEIEQFLLDHNLKDNVYLLGSRTDVSCLYQMFDLFILPSVYEGFPMVLVESQTSGLPCLISDKVTKSTDLIKQAQYLSIDADGAVSAWADAIETTTIRSDNEREMAKIEVDMSGFSIKQCSEQLQKLYENK